MVIKNDAYARTGAVLVPVDTPVTKEVVAILTKHFIEYVMVDYQATPSVPKLTFLLLNQSLRLRKTA